MRTPTQAQRLFKKSHIGVSSASEKIWGLGIGGLRIQPTAMTAPNAGVTLEQPCQRL